MLRAGVLAAFLSLVMAGCAGPGAPEPADTGSASTRTLFEWSGHIVVGGDPAERPTHFRPTEDVLWPIWQEGILFSVDALPQAMEVAVEWPGAGALMIMLHSHKDHGGGPYVEHVTPMNGTSPQCLRVPTADLSEGPWQVMVHSDGAVDTDFTMHIGLQGGAAHIIKDDRHGHWYHEEPIPDADPHDIEPCQMLMQPTNLTIPTTLPAESHFVFGTTAGCQNPSAGGPACGEFLAGPGGTGMGIDGHWIPLGEPYWNLLLTSTIDQGGVNHDSDCVFTDASGTIIKTVIPPEPCTAQVPEGAEWVFVYPSFAVAVGMTVDFVFPPAP